MIERLLLIPLILLVSSPLAFGTSDPLSCADNSIVAGAVPTTKDIQTFVQCAYELVREVGLDEDYRAFHEDAQWRSGPTYVFVDEVTPMAELAQAFVFPPDPSRERVNIRTTADRRLWQLLLQGTASYPEQLW